MTPEEVAAFTLRERELRNDAYEQGQRDAVVGLDHQRLWLAKAFALVMLDRVNPHGEAGWGREIVTQSVSMADALLDELAKPRGKA